MKSLFFLLLGFFILFGSPMQAMDFDNDVSVEYVLSVDTDCDMISPVVKNQEGAPDRFVELFKHADAVFNVYFKEVLETYRDVFVHQDSQEVDFIDTGYLVMYFTSSNETISEIPDVSNVNVHFGSINFLDTCFMSAHNYKRTS